mmetsp:Transcript_95804/g.247702  ORF Transcript_95804/g.247702 Transcript_95804/m.247702 type:complete len:414 (+) Transcript_95804:456-1697(+)
MSRRDANDHRWQPAHWPGHEAVGRSLPQAHRDGAIHAGNHLRRTHTWNRVYEGCSLGERRGHRHIHCDRVVKVGEDEHLRVVRAAAGEGQHVGKARRVDVHLVALLGAEAAEVGLAQHVQAVRPQVGRRGHVEVVTVRGVAVVLGTDRAPGHRGAELLTRPAVQGRAGRVEVLLVARVVQRHTWPEGDDGEAHVHLVHARHRLHAPLIVVVAKGPHRVLAAVRQRVIDVEHWLLRLVGKRQAIGQVRHAVDHGREHVPVGGVDDAALQRRRVVDEALLVAGVLGRVHHAVLAAAGHRGVTLGRHEELTPHAEALLAERLRILADRRGPALEERERHLHRGIDAEAVNVRARNECLRHRDVLVRHVILLLTQVVHHAVDLTVVDFPRLEVVLKVTVVVEVGVDVGPGLVAGVPG